MDAANPCFTVITSTKPDRVGKIYTLDAKGLRKDRGRFDRSRRRDDDRGDAGEPGHGAEADDGVDQSGHSARQLQRGDAGRAGGNRHCDRSRA